jgi:hypothetical protein
MCTRDMCEMLGFWDAFLKILKQEPDAVLGWICTAGPPSMRGERRSRKSGFRTISLVAP